MASSQELQYFDVVVVGAGLSGLTACDRLISEKPKLKICLVEARSRVGGRTETIGQFQVDIGAQWIGKTHVEMLSLAQRFKLKLLDQYYPAAASTRLTECVGYANSVLSPDVSAGICNYIKLVQMMSTDIDLSEPWNHPMAKVWDYMTVAQHVENHVTSSEEKREILLFVQTVLACCPENTSFLFFLFYVKSGGGMEALGDGDLGAQKWKIQGGMQQISLLLKEQLFHRGHDFMLEQAKVIEKCQIIICTPGRVLQHLEQTPQFDISNTLRILVLDECDRLLDLGFKDQLERLMEYLPKPRQLGGTRQTMLFSATQTKSIQDLARLSLRDPEYISIHEKDETSTPEGLKQLYIVTELGEKIDLLFSFVKSHLRTKILVFVSTCKQVQFLDVIFRRLRPGIPVMALHGKQSPTKRTAIYESYCSRPHALLISTDVSSRGLDFPNVDWVLQLDCPEDTKAYIHRVGRTARYKKNGNSLLVLLPSESAAFLEQLSEMKVPIKKLGVNPAKKQSIQDKVQGLLIADTELKLLANKAFKSYLRSVHLQPNRRVFDVKQLSFKQFAASFGLSSTPRIKFSGKGGEQGRELNRKIKNRDYLLEDAVNSSSTSSDDGEDYEEHEHDEKSTKQTKKVTTKWERVLKKKPLPSRVKADDENDDDDEGDDDGGLQPVAEKAGSSKAIPPPVPTTTKSRLSKVKPLKFSNDGEVRGQKRPKVVHDFDDEELESTENKGKVTTAVDSKKNRSDFVDRLAAKLREEDIQDREANRKRVKEKHKEQKAKLKRQINDEEYGDDDGDERIAVLGASSDNDEESTGGDYDDEEIEKKALRLIENGD